MRFNTVFGFIISLLLISAPDVTLAAPDKNPPDDVRHYYQLATDAYRAQDYPNFLANTQVVFGYWPNNPVIMYDLARGYCLNGDFQEAFRWLNRLAAFGVISDLQSDEDFATIKELPAFQALHQRFMQNGTPIVKSEIAFGIKEKDFIPSGLAYSPADDAFFVGSIRKRKVARFEIKRDKVVNFILERPDSLWGVFGMQADKLSDALWLCSSGAIQAGGFRPEDDGRCGVFQYNLSTAKLVKKYIMPADPEKPHFFGHLTLSKAGDVFVSDAYSQEIYTVSRQKDRLELLIGSKDWVSLQGLALADNQTNLFVADYGDGIYNVDLKTRKFLTVACPDSINTAGITALYFYQNSLVAVQNRMNGTRLVRFYLNQNLSEVTRSEVIEVNNPYYREPGSGVIVNDVFYYIANSQWTNFDERGRAIPHTAFVEPIILKVPLK